MNELDRKIREALPADEAELLGPLDEPPLWEQVTQMFRGRLGWLMVVLVVAILAGAVFPGGSPGLLSPARTAPERTAPPRRLAAAPVPAPPPRRSRAMR